ncbi:hypothetical protein QQ045_007666 [Rhodiola kirilowii]
MANFFWDSGSISKRHWIKWSLICNPKNEGGLGLKKISDRAIQPLILRLRSESYWAVGRADTLIRHLCEWLNVTVPPEGVGWTIIDVVNNAEIRDLFVASLPPILRILVDRFVLTDQPDKLLWKNSRNGSFSVKHYYLAKRVPLPIQRLFTLIWKSWIPPKISGLLWRLFHQVVPTDDKIIRLGFQM